MKPDPKFNGRYVLGAGGTRFFVEEIGDRSRPSIARHISYASRVDYPNCGHLPFAEMPERFNKDIVEFMNTIQHPFRRS